MEKIVCGSLKMQCRPILLHTLKLCQVCDMYLRRRREFCNSQNNETLWYNPNVSTTLVKQWDFYMSYIGCMNYNSQISILNSVSRKQQTITTKVRTMSRNLEPPLMNTNDVVKFILKTLKLSLIGDQQMRQFTLLHKRPHP